MPDIDFGPISPVNVAGGIPGLLCNIAESIFTLALIAAVIAFLVAAFYYLTAAGNEQRVSRAKETLTYVVFGVVVAFLAWGATFIIASTLSGGGAGGALYQCP